MAEETRLLIRMILSAFIAGVIGVGTNLLSAINASGELPKGALLIALLSGGVLVAKDIQAILSQPPRMGRNRS